MENYFGKYQRFEAPSKRDAAMLLSADNMIGDVYEIVCERVREEDVDSAEKIASDVRGESFSESNVAENSAFNALLKNRFNKCIGFFDADFSRQMSVLAARGFVLRAVLSFVAFTDHPGEGHYWGEVAVIAYDPNSYNGRGSEIFPRFIETVATRMGDGLRTKVNFDAQGVQNIVDSDGEWVPKQTEPMPTSVDQKGTAIMKKQRKFSDKMIEQGRAGNKGCYVVSWIFLLAAVALLVWAFKSCTGL